MKIIIKILRGGYTEYSIQYTFLMAKKYILSVYPKNHNLNHAGSKAVADVEAYANEIGFETINICNTLDNKYIKLKDIIISRISLKNKINKGDLILFQYPSIYGKGDKIISKLYIQQFKNKGVNTVAIIHDLECLRLFRDENTDKYLKNEIDILNSFDYVISHNQVMTNWLKKEGLKSKIIDLELFDYRSVINNSNTEYNKKVSIAFAGNLDEGKSGFVYKLNNLQFEDIKINLYGPNYNSEKNINGNVQYKGVYAPEDLNKVFNEQFGLIWDGNDLNTCSGKIGEYTKYNNPHKLSLYISAALPVIVWKKAAIAKFVEKYNIGLVADSIHEVDFLIKNITEVQYNEIKDNIKKLQSKVIDGFFIKTAIEKIESDIKSKN